MMQIHYYIFINYTWLLNYAISCKNDKSYRKNAETALDAELGSIIRASKWFREIIYASHPNPFRCRRIIEWKPFMVSFICSCCYYCIFNSKENCWSQKERRLTYGLWGVNGLWIWSILVRAKITRKRNLIKNSFCWREKSGIILRWIMLYQSYAPHKLFGIRCLNSVAFWLAEVII